MPRPSFIAAAVAAAALAACSDRPPLPGSSGGGGGGGGDGASGAGGGPPPTRDIDLLFVIDNSSAMHGAQTRLVDAFPALLAWFEGLPGGMPNLHLAVVNTDLGAGDGSIVACEGAGSGGAFQHRVWFPCPENTLAPGATFLSIEGGVANHTLPLSEAFACIAHMDESGCGFERPLAAIARALGADKRPPPPENVGFLRPGAVLAIVVLSNEDDCSASTDALYDTTDRRLASRLGPVSSFRCNEFGHVCGTPPRPPPRIAPTGSLTDTVELSDCVSAEDQGMLIPVAVLARQVKALKPYPDKQIVVAAITGPATPYVVTWESSPLVDTGPWPMVQQSCTASGDNFLYGANPAVRTRDWTRAFGENGLLSSICDPTFDTALLGLAARLGALIVP